jgi:hypothetical protein
MPQLLLSLRKSFGCPLITRLRGPQSGSGTLGKENVKAIDDKKRHGRNVSAAKGIQPPVSRLKQI